MKKIDLKDITARFTNLNVLVIGDVMVDTYLWGTVARISPEAPVPVVSCFKRENRLGGAANVGLNLYTLGANPIMCSIVGDDEKGRTFLSLLKKQNITNEGILISKDRTTTSKTRVLGQNQQLLRVDQEQTDYISKELEKEFLLHIKNIINNKNIDVVIFQDYDKGNITPGIINDIVELVNSKKIPVLVDPKKRNFDRYRKVTVFKPNFKEFIEGLNVDVPINDPHKIHEIAKTFIKERGVDFLLLTLSEKGMFVCNSEKYIQVPTNVRDVADVSGAGDTVISVAALCWALGMDMGDSTRVANLAGGLVCEKVGVVPIESGWLVKANDKVQ